jgi:hypothetical protein
LKELKSIKGVHTLNIKLSTFATGTHLRLLKHLRMYTEDKIIVDVFERADGSVDLFVSQPNVGTISTRQEKNELS